MYLKTFLSSLNHYKSVQYCYDFKNADYFGLNNYFAPINWALLMIMIKLAIPIEDLFVDYFSKSYSNEIADVSLIDNIIRNVLHIPNFSFSIKEFFNGILSLKDILNGIHYFLK